MLLELAKHLANLFSVGTDGCRLLKQRVRRIVARPTASGTVLFVTTQPAGWYPDPTNPLQEKLWDGEEWLDRVRPCKPDGEQRADDKVRTPTIDDPPPTTGTLQDDTEVLFRIPQGSLTSEVRRNFEAELDRRGIEYYWEGDEIVLDKHWESQVDELVNETMHKSVLADNGTTEQQRNGPSNWAVPILFLILLVFVGSKLGFVRDTFRSNNDRAQAACITRGGVWFRDSQSCVGGSPTNNDQAQAACITRGGLWFRDLQSCIGGLTVPLDGVAPTRQLSKEERLKIFSDDCASTVYADRGATTRFDFESNLCHITDSDGLAYTLCLGAVDGKWKVYPDWGCWR